MAACSCLLRLGFQNILFLFVSLTLVILAANSERSFGIDYKHNTFVRDGKPYRYISGSIHYFRVPYQYWDDRLKKMAAAGLNAVQIYVAWNVHEPSPGVYNFSGQQNISQFLEIAQSYNLSVILRAGPYICAEWEYGGLPAWLLTYNPQVKVRTSDPSYLKPVEAWLDTLYPILVPHLYKNGGNIISIQIENEYGSFYACDYDYLRFLRQKTIDHVGEDVVLFTTDGDGEGFLKCGTLQGLYTTVDFGITSDPAKNFKVQREWEPQGPLLEPSLWTLNISKPFLVNSEYYTGWMDHWGKNHSVYKSESVAKCLDKILALGANVNLYMFEGGTNFGFWNGANVEDGLSLPTTTSYDHDAPMSEAGDIIDKYWVLRKVIAKYNPPPAMKVPPSTPKYAYGKVEMKFMSTVYEYVTTVSKPTASVYPLTMEQIRHYYGYILYRHQLVGDVMNETLNVSGVRDRGYIWLFSDGFSVPVGIVDRIGNTSVHLTASKDQYLCILVENQGRINYGTEMNYNHKGLISNVTLSNNNLTKWEQFPVTISDDGQWLKMQGQQTRLSNSTGKTIVPSIFEGTFIISGEPEDTYLDMSLWTKGQILINGHNIGRYWPKKGPQVRLYIPKFFLKTGLNQVIMIELEKSPCTTPTQCTVDFMDQPLINGTVIPNENIPRQTSNFDWHLYH